MKKLLLILLCVGATFFLAGCPPRGCDEVRDPQAMLDLLAGAAGKENTRIVIPPGIYRICDTKVRAVSVDGLRKSTIVADGVTVVLKTGQSFKLNGCADVTLTGLTVDFDPLPFSQGKITEIDPVGKSITVVLDEGYPALESLPKESRLHYGVYDPVTAEPRSLLHDGFPDVVPVGDRTYKLSRASNGFLFDSLGRPDGAQVGDQISLYNRQNSAIEVRNGSRVHLDGVTVFSAPGFAIWEVEGEGGNHYSRCRIMRKPGTTRLLSGSADGFHSYQVRKGPLIEGCEFSDMVDDTIAIHGFFSIVLESPSSRTVYVVSPFGQDFSAGAGVSFHEMPHGNLLAEAVVKSVETLPAASLSKPIEETQRAFIKQRLNMRSLPPTQATLKVELDRDIALPQGKLVLISSSERCGSGAVIRNNTLRRGHMRGVLVKADNVLIENNRFESTGASAVLVQPELFFLEGPVCKGVTIRGNTITHCGWKILNQRFAFPGVGAIQTGTWMARRQFPPQFDPYPAIGDVTITDNIIEDSGGYGIVLGNVSKGRIANNTIKKPFGKSGAIESTGLDKMFDSTEHNLKKPADPRATPAGILVYGSKDVNVSGNSVSPASSQGGLPALIVGPWCDNLTTPR